MVRYYESNRKLNHNYILSFNAVNFNCYGENWREKTSTIFDKNSTRILFSELENN